jgi:hypothetical protein
VSGRPSREVGLALAHIQRTGCTPQAAADKYGLAVSTVRRALLRAGFVLRKRGRPPSYGHGLAHVVNTAPCDSPSAALD